MVAQRARITGDILRRRDVLLFRSAFDPALAPGAVAEELRLAALGDAGAALRLAHQASDGRGQPRRQLGWSQYASLLGSEQAAYALALHYRRESQPLLAAQFESRALALGFVPLPSLDHTRK